MKPERGQKKGLRICLVNGVNRDVSIKEFSILPYNLHVLKACTPPEHDVKIIGKYVRGRLPDADIYGFSLTSSNKTTVYPAADRLLEQGKTVIFGGPSTLTDSTAGEHCTTLVIGEAEECWPGIIRDAQENKLEKTYRCKEIDMKNFPIIDRKDCGTTMISNLVQTTRGCPYSCAFCNMHKHTGKGIRTRPVENVIKEIRTIEQESKGIFRKLLFFTDINIIADKRYAKELFRKMEGTPLRWFAQASIDIANDTELLDLAHAAGCRGLYIGYESVDRQNLQEVKPQNKDADYLQLTKRIKDRDILVMGSFIMGLDNDTPRTFRDTMRFAQEADLDLVQLFTLVPLPGTRLYDKLQAEGRVMPDLRFTPKHMTYRNLLMNTKRLHERLHSYRRITRKFITHAGRYPLRYASLLAATAVFLKHNHGKAIEEQIRLSGYSRK